MKFNFSYKSIIPFFKKQTSAIFWLALIILLILESFVINRSVQIILEVHRTQNVMVNGRLVRINFSVYNQIVERISKASVYTPQDPIQTNPFGLSSKSTK